MTILKLQETKTIANKYVYNLVLVLACLKKALGFSIRFLFAKFSS